MHYFQGSREHRPPGGGGALWHAQELNTHTLSGSPTTTEISTVWKNRYSTELIDSSTETYDQHRGRIQRWGQGVRTPPLVIHINIEFLSNTGPNPLKNHKNTNPALNVGPSSARQRKAISMAFRCRTDDGPLIVVF